MLVLDADCRPSRWKLAPSGADRDDLAVARELDESGLA